MSEYENFLPIRELQKFVRGETNIWVLIAALYPDEYIAWLGQTLAALEKLIEGQPNQEPLVEDLVMSLVTLMILWQTTADNSELARLTSQINHIQKRLDMLVADNK